MPADEAVLIMQNEGKYKPKKGSGGETTSEQPVQAGPSGKMGGSKGY
jgi:hypothetical protein